MVNTRSGNEFVVAGTTNPRNQANPNVVDMTELLKVVTNELTKT